MFSEGCIKRLNDGNIETVEPEDGIRTRISMIVPGPWRRYDEVALVHDRALAIHRGVSALTLKHETKCRLGVPVCGCDLARHDKLHAGIHIRGDFRLAAQAGIFKNEHATFRLFRR